jgi:chromosome segregation ATPase
MSTDKPEQTVPKEAPPKAEEAESRPPTDEDVLRLRGRLDREFALVTQKIADAEETVREIEATLKAYETSVKPRRPADKGTEKTSSPLSFSKIKDWVTKPKEAHEPEVPSTGKVSNPDTRSGRVPRDLDERLEDMVQRIAADIRDRERDAGDIDRRLHEAQTDLIARRANEQRVREMQIRIGQTRHLSEDLERKMAMLDEMVRSFESKTQTDTGLKPKQAVPKIDDRLQTALDEAVKAVEAQEKKVAELEKDLERAQAALVEDRARQQRVRTMQIRLRQVRHLSADLQRGVGGLGPTIDDLRRRAAGLLKPESEGPKA